MGFRCTPPPARPVETLCETPWKMAVEPFQVSPRTFYVSGQTWVGAYLVRTSEGLMLIDCAIPESMYLLVDSIYKLGYKPSDVKKILISHAHFDHMGAAMAMQKLTGAELYMSREDYEFMQMSVEETYVPSAGSHVQMIDVVPTFFDDETPVVLGDMEIHTVLTPGHTIGCTSFWWEEMNPVNGEKYMVAMHGGVGANTMNDKYYASSKCMTPAHRQRFFDDAEKVAAWPVDIALPSHPNQIAVLDQAGKYTHENQIYLDKTIWGDFIRERVRQVKELMK